MRCIDCGKPVPKGDNCCVVCFNKPSAKPKPPENWRKCKHCGKPFQDRIYDDGTYGRTLFCSEDCSRTFYATQGKTKHCYWCGIEFKGHHAAMFCSVTCRVAAHRAGKKAPPNKNTTPSLPPLIKLRFDILERDSFRCRYCGRSADEGTVLQIDHVNPRSNGGDWNPNNLLTACRECNLGKRDRILKARFIV